MRPVLAQKDVLTLDTSKPDSNDPEKGTVLAKNDSLKLAGDLAGFNLADVVQLIIVTKKTGVLSISYDNEVSSLYFEHGRVIHAEKGDIQGEEIAYSFFLPQVGNFEFVSDVPSEKRTLDIDGTFFLMEAMRKLDEVETVALAETKSDQEVMSSILAGLDDAQFNSADDLAGDSASQGEGGPKLSLITNEMVLEMDLYRGAEEGGEQAVSLGDDLVAALLAHSPSGEQAEQVELEDDPIALKLSKVDWIASFSMFLQNGYPITSQNTQGTPLLGEEGVATVAVLEFSAGLGKLLSAGEFECAIVTEKNNSKAILADIEGRYVSARLKPGSPSKKIVSKILAGLTLV